MRKHLIYCTAMICCFLTACGTSEAPLVDVNNSAEESVSSEISSADSNTNTDEEPFEEPFEELDYDAFYGCGFENGTDADGNPVMADYDNIPVENNTMSLTLFNRIQMKEPPAEGKRHAYMLMGINGQLYDFTVDGKTSTNGILETDIPVNQDVRVPFEIKDLPAQSGDNTFAFYTVLPEEDSYGIMEYTGTFHADAANEGVQPVSLTAEAAIQNIETDTADGKTQDEIINPNGGVIRMFDKDAVQSFDDTTGTCKLKQSTQIYYELVNINDDNGPSNRSGVCLAVFDGKPMNIWNGSPFAAVSMKDNELLKRIPMTADLKPGESGQIGCIYFDLSNETGELKTAQITEKITVAE